MKIAIAFIITMFSMVVFAQEDEDDVIIDDFEDYTELIREQIHVHLNKTVYIKGEMLAFKAYVFDGESKFLSNNTANLYCQILDSKNNVVAEKLVMVNQGTSRGDFDIDSTFTSGEYKFKAYTNWMRNFESEHHYFLESFRVIDAETVSTDKPISASQKIDLQILPESGHLLSDVENVVGIIAKDELGLGVANLKVDILDDEDNTVVNTTLNRFGIGTFLLHPKPGKAYYARYSYNENPRQVDITNIESRGVVLSLKSLDDGVTVTMKTNTATFPLASQQNYKLYIHNGFELRDVDLRFREKTQITIKINSTDLFPGVNIFTLFNGDRQPIAERMYFNYEGVELSRSSGNQVVKSLNDSLEIKLPFKQVNQSLFQSFSVSVLPSETRSYYHNESIVSSLLLKPYLKSSVQQAGYYFTNVDQRKTYELDRLLLTQGWSSYDWNTIFNAPPDYIFDFEVGINYTINTNDSKGKQLLIYPNINTSSEFVMLDNGQRSLERRGLFPLDDEKLRIGEIQKNGQLGKSSVVLQFSPVNVKPFATKYVPKTVLRADQSANTEDVVFDFKDAEKLEEVKLVAKRGYTRIEKLQNKTLGKITEFGEMERRQYRTFGQFISRMGFIVDETLRIDPDTEEMTMFRIENRNPPTINGSIEPTIFMDGALLIDLDILNNFSMEVVDYVEVNRSGLGEGMRGGAGVIRIFTDPNKKFKIKQPRDSFTAYDIPLTYATPKRFYIPKYNNYDGRFFKEYGVVDWFPNVTVGEDGYISLKVADKGQPLKLFIEGLVNNESLVSQTIEVNNN